MSLSTPSPPMPDATEVLNRVLARLRHSFPQYLIWASPYIPPGRENAMRTIERIAADQNALAERVTQVIHDSGGTPDPGRFPIEYTDTHDLAIDFLLEEAIRCQRRDISDLERYVEVLRFAPGAQALAAEALGMAKGQLESLESARAGASGSMKEGTTPAFANDVPASHEATNEPHRQDARKTLAGQTDSLA